jgi:predicted ArsR family transcriptional regulator
LNDQSLPQLVIEFVIAHLRTIDDLHLLVAMSGAQDRWFDADRVARELGIGRQTARAALEHLAGRNLLEIRVTGDVRYQFNPGTPALREAAGACVEAYRRNPMALWRLAAEQLDHRSLRDFADAFKIRRHDDR